MFKALLKDAVKALGLRAAVLLGVFVWMVAISMSAQAQQPPNRDGWRDSNERPRWCRMYSRQDYWQERRACGRDWECRRHADRKAERCGLR